MSRQWKRKAQVVIGKQGSGLLIENLRIAFEVTKTADTSPNTAIIKIWNLNPENEARIKREFEEVLLNCGYEDAALLTFRGNIKRVFRYRDKTDFITEIEAADGDKDFQLAVMNLTLAAGTTNEQIAQRAVGSFSDTGAGYISLPQKARLRGRVISGNTRNVLDDLARDSGASWSIQDGRLVIVPDGGVLPNEAIVISAETGMLSSPELNDQGVTVKCLLNPRIAINGVVKLDNDRIRSNRSQGGKTEKTGERIVSDPSQLTGESARLSSDGLYRVIRITHRGDTRGSEWMTESLSVAL